MFRQLVAGTTSRSCINSLFLYHPLQISAIAETVWLNRNNAGGSGAISPFVPWPPQMVYPILKSTDFFPGYAWSGGTPSQLPIPLPAGMTVGDFVVPVDQPGIKGTWDGVAGFPPLGFKPTYWDHLIYAYVIENTRIFEIFSKVLETYMFSEQLETPTPPSQLFWRNLEFLIFGDAMPSMVWTTAGRTRRDEVANRLTVYYWMFGIDLSHAPDVARLHPYPKPDHANRDFIPTFESFAGEVWRGILNAKNTSGPNETDSTAVATLARRIYDMMATRRLNGNLSREEFRAVAIMSYLHLAVLYDSPAVVDLKATASSPEMRLQKIAERVGMSAHPKSKPFFDLAGPFSKLMQEIESGAFNKPALAQALYFPPSAVSQNAEVVIDQYSLATGRDLKSSSVSTVQRAKTTPVPVTRNLTHKPAPQLTARRPDGPGTPTPTATR
jgi:hypothetical protein